MSKAKFAFASLLVFSLASFAAPPQPAPSVLKPAFAGSWYSADPKELASQLDALLDEAKPDFARPPLALIQPHAGYAYSARTMAYGASLLKGSDVQRVVAIGPSHRVFMKNMLCAPEAAALETPLGRIPVDLEFLAKLRESGLLLVSDKIHSGEHSVQMQLPMLQRALPGGFKIVPLIAGALDEETRSLAANALLRLVDSKTVVVASSDFAHYGASYGYLPFKDDVKENLRKLDMGAFERIKAIDPFGLREYIDRTGDTVCGECPVGILLRMLPKDAGCALLKYDSSGAQSNDFSSSVSYLSIAFSGSWPEPRKGFNAPSPETDALLGEADRQALLQIARKSLTYGFVSGGRSIDPNACGVELSPAMRKPMGAFVTLKVDGELRGCIGEIFAVRPLCEAVAARAVDSAFRDSRFAGRKLTLKDLPKIEIEVSALTQPKRVASWKDIELGRHGIVMSSGGSSAVFLPQVAPEQGWSLEQTLTHLCVKAGVPQDSWKGDATFSVFEAVVFGEPRAGERPTP